MTAKQLAASPQKRQAGRGATSHVLIGGLCGLAWAAGLRGFMAKIAGSESTVDWAGTFGWILVPGTLVGALLGVGGAASQLGHGSSAAPSS
jgi:hypothetical protein